MDICVSTFHLSKDLESVSQETIEDSTIASFFSTFLLTNSKCNCMKQYAYFIFRATSYINIKYLTIMNPRRWIEKNAALEQETDTSQIYKNCHPERMMGNFSYNVSFQGGS